MAAQNLDVEQWTEIAFVEIADNATSPNIVQFGTITDTIDISIGTRDIEAIALLSSGRVTKFTPEELTELTLEIYPIGASSTYTTSTAGATSTSPNGILSWFWGLAPNTKQGKNAFGRKYFRVSMMWTDTVTNLSTGVPTVSNAHTTVGNYLRLGFWMAYLTDAKLDFTDDILKQTITFKCLPFDRTGASRISFEEYYVDGVTVTQVPAMDSFASGAAPGDVPF